MARSTTWTYAGPLHQLSQIDGPRTDVADITTFEYYPDDAAQGANRARLLLVTDANNLRLRDNIQYSATGKVLSESRPNGLSLSYTYYPGNDRLETLSESDGTRTRVTRWTYLATGEVQTITQAHGAPEATTLTFGYDDARRLTRITDGLGNYIDYELDTEGNRRFERIHDSSNALRKQLEQTFDIYNRLDTTAQANEASNPDFAADGTLDRSTDGRGAVTDYSYDALKRLTQVVQDQNGVDTGTANATTGYGYDVADRLTSVTDPIDGTTTYVYDDLGNLLSQTSPDTGTTTFSYDSAGNLASKTDALDQRFVYSYDALNRLTLRDAPGTVDDISYSYDACPGGSGRLCSVSRNNATVSYAYDGLGQVTLHQGIGYSYDAAGRVRTITYPSGALVTYSYNAAGRVSRVQLTRDGVTEDLANSISHAPFGGVTGLIYGNGHSLSQGYDTAYRLINQSVPGIQQFNYDLYDANGNLEQRSNASVTESYSYDPLDRLDTASGGFGTRDYDHDKNGNRTQRNSDGTLTAYSYSPNSNRMTTAGGNSVTLNANGNTIFKGNRYYTYTADNRLKDAYINWQLKGSYAYNGLGQRVSKTVYSQMTRFHYGLNGELLAESSAGGTQWREYVYLDGQPLAMLDTGTAGVGSPTLTQTTTPAQVGGTIGAAWAGIAAPTEADWIGVYAVGSDDFAYLDWTYINGTASGSTSLTLNDASLVPGQSYELRLYSNNSYTRLATSAPFVLNPTGPTVIAASTPVERGGSVQVAWSGIAIPTGTDWYGIYAVGAADSNYTVWDYTQGVASGSASLPLNHFMLVAGQTYELRLFANDGYTRLATSGSFVLTAPAGPASSEVYFIHNDHLGTPKAVTDAAGNKVWSATHDPFGLATVDAGSTIEMHVRFPGQYYDSETGLHYNYFRTYDPGMGRYLTSDPIGLDGGLNTYGYALANPLKYFDPNGASATATWSGYAGAGEGVGAGAGSRALGVLGPLGVLIGGMWPATMGDGTLGEGATPYPGFDEPKQCDTTDDYCEKNAKRLNAERNFLIDAQGLIGKMNDAETYTALNNDIIRFNREVEAHNKICQIKVLPLKTLGQQGIHY